MISTTNVIPDITELTNHYQQCSNIIIICNFITLCSVQLQRLFYENHNYPSRSNCDFVLDAEGDNAKEIGSLYFALMGPIPMFLSLLLIIVTNSVIVIYIMKRYKVININLCFSWIIIKLLLSMSNVKSKKLSCISRQLSILV